MVLNVSVIFLAIILSFLLLKELVAFASILLAKGTADYQLFLANILIFFLYFQFVAMIIKYFKENYHFPLRYFLYIGITAMIRLIILL
ncbi:phosphate-starvation-inducible PsiE family protein [Virgibacillus proomii]|nr:phosphate-starvation-inducible PsiE family protein [Virgibacillus proomii]